MRAILLAAGKATRLGEVAQVTPKCLLEVGNELLLDRVVRQLRAAGVDKFLVNTHHLSEQVIAHVQARPDHSDFTLVHEPELLGTLGTVRRNVDFFGDLPGWVLHADNYIEGSLSDLSRGYANRPKAAWGAMLTFEAADPSSCGVVVTDEEGLVTDFFEKVQEPPGRWASAATFVFGREILDAVRLLPSEATDLSRDLIPILRNRLVAVRHEGQVVDIGTPQGLGVARSIADEVKGFG